VIGDDVVEGRTFVPLELEVVEDLNEGIRYILRRGLEGSLGPSTLAVSVEGEVETEEVFEEEEDEEDDEDEDEDEDDEEEAAVDSVLLFVTTPRSPKDCARFKNRCSIESADVIAVETSIALTEVNFFPSLVVDGGGGRTAD